MSKSLLVEMDAQIAEKVMDYKNVKFNKDPEGNLDWWEGTPPGSNRLGIIPKFSIDMNHALLVLERLRELKWDIEIISLHKVINTDNWGVILSDTDVTAHGPGGTTIVDIRPPIHVNAETLQLAVCGAALKAVENDRSN